jgi:hypothetical protein
VQEPFIKSKWYHIPITFSQEDLQLKDYPPQRCNGYILCHQGISGSQCPGCAADIIFAKAFRQMQQPDDKIHDATHPLCGFRGRQIVALGKITMLVTFAYVHNTRIE